MREDDREQPTGAPPPDRDLSGRWIMTFMAGLVAAGVAWLWQLSTSVARLDERLGNWISVSERFSTQVARDLRDADRRLDAIERGYQMPPPQSDRRQ